MPSNLPQPRPSLFPARGNRQIGKQLAHMDDAALAAAHSDALRVGRAQHAATHGLVAVAQISSLEASLVQLAPHAEGRLRAVADAGTIGIAAIVAQSGF
jgi:hypothetical protein